MGGGVIATFLKFMKKQTMNFPELLPAYISAILKQKGHKVTYAVNQLDPSADIVLIQTSIIDCYEETRWAKKIKEEYPQIRIGFMGGFASGWPEFYDQVGDFVLLGDAENIFMHEDIHELSGVVKCGYVKDLDSLPFPDWSHIRDWKPRYGVTKNSKGRIIPMLSSRGCPMSCAYYCTYPLVQGNNYRARSPENIVDEIAYLQTDYGMTSVLFRDPIFSFDMDRIVKMCELILSKGLYFSWICETHPRFLSPDLINLMAKAGCSAVKLGIESGSQEVMKNAKRVALDFEYQEMIVHRCEKAGIDVLAFYMLGYYDDLEGTVEETIKYALQLNTFGAQFTIATPYPGTPWYTDLKCDHIELDDNLEHYNQYRLVYQQPNFKNAKLEQLKSKAYRQYYFRWGFIKKHLLKLD